MIRLVLLRHGESTWNKENRFTGWTDVDLTDKGREEAREAGRLLKEAGFQFDVAYTSVLTRAIRTLWLALDEMQMMWIPIHNSWRLNERHYGALQGLNKAETAAKHGDAQVKVWRRSYDVPPPPLDAADPRHPSHDSRYASLAPSDIPLTESLKDTVARFLPHWHEVIAPAIKSGRRVVIAAHGNSLRALVKYLDDVSEADILELNIPTAIPLIYELDDDLKPLKKYYLGDQDAAARKAQAVANQGKAQAAEDGASMAGGPAFRTPADIADLDAALDLGQPGEFPYTRGIHPTMYRGRPWTIRQYAGFGSAQESNARYRYLLSQGSTGLSVAFDLPTQIGYDSDHRLAAGEVGRVGVAIDSIEDMAVLFDGIRLDTVSTSMTINATAMILLALYVAVARRQGSDVRALAGTLQNDILKEYVARGTYIFPPRPSMRLVADVVAYCEREIPKWHPVSVSGYHIREAGSTATQEVAFTLAHACAYVETCAAAGLDVNAVGARLSFFFNAHNNFLEEIAKFRAARRLWARLMRDRFGATEPRAQQLRFHAQTAGSTLTARQPDTNIVRVTLQAMAAVLGGAQSIHTNSRDEALGLPTEDSATLALRTQQILLHESGLTQVVDPFGGSYAIEEMTDRIERDARRLIETLDAQGGVLAAIERGFVQREIQDSAYRAQRAIDAGEQVVVGINRFVDDAAVSSAAVFRLAPEVEREQTARVRALRASRSQTTVTTVLAGVEQAARDGSNLVPLVVAAVEGLATLGEIADCLRGVFGEYRENASV